LKEAGINSFKLWSSLGKPRSGRIFDEMTRDKLRYKLPIKTKQDASTNEFSNSLNDALLSKDMDSFWRTWRSKLSKSQPPSVIDGCHDDKAIADKFASVFQSVCVPNSASRHAELCAEFFQLYSKYYMKQSSRCWNKTFSEYLKELKFVHLKAECCIFKREEPLTFIALYVDDIIVIASDVDVVKTKLELSKRFQMKDMGPLHYILGITCIQNQLNGKIGLMQEMYIDKLIDRYGLNDSKVVSTPSDCSVTLMKSDGISNLCDKSLYQSLVGSLLYAALVTRPDIQFAVSTVAKYCSEPDQSRLTAAKRILRYLKKNKKLCVVAWF